MLMKTYPPGKLPAAHLEKLLSGYRPADPRVILGGKTGEDAAVMDMGDRYLVAKTDPITFATDEIGWYAVNINANDIACTGAIPRWFLATVLLPEKTTTPSLVDDIFRQITAACTALDISLVGGHTEITFGLDRPIVVGQMLGEAEKSALVRTGGAQIGDTLLLTKSIAIEGLSIIAREKANALRGQFSAAEITALANLLHTPGISVLKEAQIATGIGGVHAMHDPTEGGIATGLHELAHAAGVGLEISAAGLPFHPHCEKICAALNLNPLGLIASGSLLLAVDDARAAEIIAALQTAGVRATTIGTVKPPAAGVVLRRADGRREPLPTFPRDEITKLFE